MRKAKEFKVTKESVDSLRAILPTYILVSELAEEIAKQRSVLSGRSHDYPDTYSIRGPSIADQGLVFYAHNQDQYDDHWNIESIFVNWDDINTDTLKQLYRDVRNKKERDAREQQKWKRQHLERLKKELGES